jgi:hypothetical protein
LLKYIYMPRRSTQDEELNSLGFVTSLMRRNIVIGFIAIILIAWSVDHRSQENDKNTYLKLNKDLNDRLDAEKKSHYEDLREEIRIRRVFQERQEKFDRDRIYINRSIKHR